MSSQHIVLDGVSTHNLKAVTVAIPKGKIVAVVGVSGSGKSSLIIDTLFEYSKSLYLGALSSRSFDMGDGDYQVERVTGAQPPVALKQSTSRVANPRSTIGTLTGLDGLFRLLYGRGSRPVCPACSKPTGPDLFCEECGCFAEPHTPKHFSPHRKEGKCLECDGVGELISFSVDSIVPDASKSLTWIWDNAEPGTFAIPNVRKAFEAMCSDEGIDLGAPWSALNERQLDLVLRGSERAYTIKVRKVTNDVRFEGILGYLDRSYRQTSSPARRQAFARYLGEQACPVCGGGRLRPESLRASIAGHSFRDFQDAPISAVIGKLDLMIGQQRLPEQVTDLGTAIVSQCRNIQDVGLGHLALGRPIVTLSGGELQRLLLAQHLASDLAGVIYILDEPTTGLHEHDTASLLDSLRRLRDLGNTVIVIEHDETVIRAADWILELGPGAGSRGGEIVFEGTVAAMLGDDRSPTAAALAAAPEPRGKRARPAGWVRLRGIDRNNVRAASVTLPVGALTCVTGVSGAGKSSLVEGVHEELSRALAARRAERTGAAAVDGLDHLDEVMYVEQRPMGRSSRSTIVTYIGISDNIRDSFAATASARELGLDRAAFSPNVAGGRCETCKGLGLIEVDMSIFTSEYVQCGDCDGKKFLDHVLAVTLAGKNIHEVLSMTVEEGLDWFGADADPAIREALVTLNEFGLGYLQLGCSTTVLSGGEAQRLNLAAELVRQKAGRTLFIFDEPTRGLHRADIQYLLALFERLLRTGNTILVIEHNLEIVAWADWVIDMGPAAGDEGGRIVYAGTVDGLAEEPAGYTGRYVKEHLARRRSESVALT